jgi:ribokinase
VRHDVVVVGSINADLVLQVPRHPLPGETLLGSSGDVFAGGKGANQAVAAARLGASTAMIGAIGTDPNARVALSQLVDAGVHTSTVSIVPGPTGLAVVTLALDGENSIIVIPGANASVVPDLAESAIEAVGTGTVCVLQAEIPLQSVIHAAALASGRGSRVVLNIAPASILPVETLRLADPLVLNEHEAEILLTGVMDVGHAATRIDDYQAVSSVPPNAQRTHRTALELRALGVPSVIITLGGKGAIGADGAGVWAVPGRRVTVRDTTGAGDAFVGALAARLARGDHLREAAITATRVAAYSVERLGAQVSYPWQGDPLP